MFVINFAETCTRPQFSYCLVTGDINVHSWYEARNFCLRKGHDLFYLTEEDIKDINTVKERIIGMGSTFLNNKFWIGLRKEVWVWTGKLNASISMFGNCTYRTSCIIWSPKGMQCTEVLRGCVI